MTTPRMQASGIFNKPKPKLPAVLPYHKYIKFTDAPDIKNKFCYIIKHYGCDGLSVLVYRQPKDDQFAVVCGDWHGNSIELNKNSRLAVIANNYIKDDLLKFVKLMNLIRLTQAQFFFAIDEMDSLRLVDIQLAINKFSGPGMVKELFGKLVSTQEIIKVEIIDDRVYEHLQTGTGSYAGDLIIKPSAYKCRHTDKGELIPFYVELRR